jgi:hypothetical protein
VIRAGEPLSNLEYVLLPLYMHHRFQLRAAVQSLGGADYRYALKGDGQTPFTIIDATEQRDALETVLSTLDVDFLTLSDDIISMIPPPAYRHSEGEVFTGYTEQIFDPLAVAEASAAFSVGEILQPQRMARLVLYGSMGDYPDLEEVVDRLMEVTWGAEGRNDEYHQRVLHTTQRTVIDQMMQQAAMQGSATDVRAILADRLETLATQLELLGSPSPHERLAAADIRRWQARIDNTTPGPVIQLPAGDPIGSPRGGSPRGGSPR